MSHDILSRARPRCQSTRGYELKPKVFTSLQKRIPKIPQYSMHRQVTPLHNTLPGMSIMILIEITKVMTLHYTQLQSLYSPPNSVHTTSVTIATSDYQAYQFIHIAKPHHIQLHLYATCNSNTATYTQRKSCMGEPSVLINLSGTWRRGRTAC